MLSAVAEAGPQATPENIVTTNNNTIPQPETQKAESDSDDSEEEDDNDDACSESASEGGDGPSDNKAKGATTTETMDSTSGLLTPELKIPIRARKTLFEAPELGRKTKKLVKTEKHTDDEMQIIDALNSHDEGLCFRKTTFRNLVYEVLSTLETNAEQFKQLAHCTLQQAAEEYVEDLFHTAVQDGHITNPNVPVKEGVLEQIAKKMHDKHTKLQMPFMDETYEQTSDEDEDHKEDEENKEDEDPQPIASPLPKSKTKKLPKKKNNPADGEDKNTKVDDSTEPKETKPKKKRKTPEPKEPKEPSEVPEAEKTKKKAKPTKNESTDTKPPKKKTAKKTDEGEQKND